MAFSFSYNNIMVLFWRRDDVFSVGWCVRLRCGVCGVSRGIKGKVVNQRGRGLFEQYEGQFLCYCCSQPFSTYSTVLVDVCFVFLYNNSIWKHNQCKMVYIIRTMPFTFLPPRPLYYSLLRILYDTILIERFWCEIFRFGTAACIWNNNFNSTS